LRWRPRVWGVAADGQGRCRNAPSGSQANARRRLLKEARPRGDRRLEQPSSGAGVGLFQSNLAYLRPPGGSDDASRLSQGDRARPRTARAQHLRTSQQEGQYTTRPRVRRTFSSSDPANATAGRSRSLTRNKGMTARSGPIGAALKAPRPARRIRARLRRRPRLRAPRPETPCLARAGANSGTTGGLLSRTPIWEPGRSGSRSLDSGAPALRFPETRSPWARGRVHVARIASSNPLAGWPRPAPGVRLRTQYVAVLARQRR